MQAKLNTHSRGLADYTPGESSGLKLAIWLERSDGLNILFITVEVISCHQHY
jgi:hypothetical protein